MEKLYTVRCGFNKKGFAHGCANCGKQPAHIPFIVPIVNESKGGEISFPQSTGLVTACREKLPKAHRAIALTGPMRRQFRAELNEGISHYSKINR